MTDHAVLRQSWLDWPTLTNLGGGFGVATISYFARNLTRQSAKHDKPFPRCRVGKAIVETYKIYGLWLPVGQNQRCRELLCIGRSQWVPRKQ